jgi:hypothetical protein
MLVLKNKNYFEIILRAPLMMAMCGMRIVILERQD